MSFFAGAHSFTMNAATITNVQGDQTNTTNNDNRSITGSYNTYNTTNTHSNNTSRRNWDDRSDNRQMYAHYHSQTANFASPGAAWDDPRGYPQYDNANYVGGSRNNGYGPRLHGRPLSPNTTPSRQGNMSAPPHPHHPPPVESTRSYPPENLNHTPFIQMGDPIHSPSPNRAEPQPRYRRPDSFAEGFMQRPRSSNNPFRRGNCIPDVTHPVNSSGDQEDADMQVDEDSHPSSS